jgi:uncharacterized protein with NRDE domain
LCTVVLLRRPGHPWPLLLAANRDELEGRPSAPPGRHWEERAQVTAGLDRQAGGSWLGVNDDGLVAAVLNRHGTLGPEPGKRSRGELVLEALDHCEAAVAAELLCALDPQAWRPFNLVVADAQTAWWLRHAGDGQVHAAPLAPGLSIIEAGELNDPHSARTRRYLPRFAAAPPPDPAADDWAAWQALLADRGGDTGDPRDAMCIVTEGTYGTRSSSLIALPADPAEPARWLHADGRPGEAAWRRVAL